MAKTSTHRILAVVLVLVALGAGGIALSLFAASRVVKATLPEFKPPTLPPAVTARDTF